MSINQFEENGDTYFQLFASCPVCHNQGRNAPRLFWTHGDNNCHGDIYVGDNAYYKCRKCGQTSHVSKMMLSCPRCSNATDGIWELKAGSSDSSALIGFIGQMVQACGLPWLQKFIVNMGVDVSQSPDEMIMSAIGSEGLNQEPKERSESNTADVGNVEDSHEQLEGNEKQVEH